MTYFHPERTPVLPPRRRAAARRQLAEIVERSAGPAGPARSASPSWFSARGGARGLRPVAITAAVAVIVLATGAFALARYELVSDKTQARCYTVASVSDDRYVAIAEASSTITRAQVRNALDVCAALYRQGILRLGRRVDYQVHAGDRFPVPSLVACTLPGGIAAVFPGTRGTCAHLNLPVAIR